jgi:hypothetical protein
MHVGLPVVMVVARPPYSEVIWYRRGVKLLSRIQNPALHKSHPVSMLMHLGGQCPTRPSFIWGGGQRQLSFNSIIWGSYRMERKTNKKRIKNLPSFN